MSDLTYAVLSERGVLEITGDDAREFLQGLVSNDVERVSEDRAIHAALLTPQGKYLHDFFITAVTGSLFLEGERDRLPDLKKRLTMYKLRAKVELADRSEDFAVAVLFGDGTPDALGLAREPGAAKAEAGGTIAIDPRLAAAGARAIMPSAALEDLTAAAGFALGTPENYDALRLGLGLPDGSRDLIVDKSILLESGFDELNGVDWDKGCYMGQELTARTKYRGLVKKRLVPVTLDGPAPAPGSPVMAGEKEAGEMRSSSGERGLALMRLEYLENPDGEFRSGDTVVVPAKPDWAVF